MADFTQQPDESDAKWLARLEGAGRADLPGDERFAAFSHEQVARSRVDGKQREARARGQAEAEAHDRAVANGTRGTAGLTPLEQAKEACRRLEAEDRRRLILWLSQAASGAEDDVVLTVGHEPG